MKKFFLLAVASLLLSACTEMEYASHLTKQAMGPDGQYASNSGGSIGQTKLPDGKTHEGLYKVGKPYKIEGQWYYPKETYSHVETGIASWYGPGFDGKRTASGEIFNSDELTAAHRTLQMPSLVRVTNLDNGKSVIVRVNDRGPYKRGRVIDLSKRAADLLGFRNLGTAKVKIELLPEESLMAANMAKQGQSTKGIEMAANNGKLSAPTAQRGSVQTASLNNDTSIVGRPASVESEVLPPGHTDATGRYLPDPIVTQMPVTRTGIYVQAGAFTVRENAENLKNTLGSLGSVSVHTAQVKGQQFYRVRIGPVADVTAADKMLNTVVGMGHNNALIVVD